MVAVAGARGFTVHAFVMKTAKGSGMPDIVVENLTQNTGGRYDVMNTTTALPDKMKALGRAAGPRSPQHEHVVHEVDIQTDAAEITPVNVGVMREGVRLQISNSRHGQ